MDSRAMEALENVKKNAHSHTWRTFIIFVPYKSYAISQINAYTNTYCTYLLYSLQTDTLHTHTSVCVSTNILSSHVSHLHMWMGIWMGLNWQKRIYMTCTSKSDKTDKYIIVSYHIHMWDAIWCRCMMMMMMMVATVVVVAVEPVLTERAIFKLIADIQNKRDSHRIMYTFY